MCSLVNAMMMVNSRHSLFHELSLFTFFLLLHLPKRAFVHKEIEFDSVIIYHSFKIHLFIFLLWIINLTRNQRFLECLESHGMKP